EDTATFAPAGRAHRRRFRLHRAGSVGGARSFRPGAVRRADPQRDDRGRHGKPLVPRRRGAARRPDRGGGAAAGGAGARHHRRDRPRRFARVDRHAGAQRVPAASRRARHQQDHAGDHQRDHGRGDQRRPCERQHVARAGARLGALERPGRLLRRAGAGAPGHQPGDVRHRGVGAALCDGRRQSRAHRGRAGHHALPCGRGHGRRCHGPFVRADLLACFLRHDRRGDRAGEGGGALRRRVRVAHPVRGRAPGGGGERGHPHRRGGRHLGADPPPEGVGPGELGEDGAGRGGHRGGPCARRGRDRRPVPVPRQRHGAGCDDPQLGARGRHRFHARAPRGSRHARAPSYGADGGGHRLEH
ncbi:MAG: N-acyl-D-amino-acid deacylase, partial [uncultured Gemmatimonadetes bacterium]